MCVCVWVWVWVCGCGCAWAWVCGNREVDSTGDVCGWILRERARASLWVRLAACDSLRSTAVEMTRQSTGVDRRLVRCTARAVTTDLVVDDGHCKSRKQSIYQGLKTFGPRAVQRIHAFAVTSKKKRSIYIYIYIYIKVYD